MNARHGVVTILLWAIGLFAVSLAIAGCGSGGPTPTPAATPVPGIGAPIDIGGTQVKVTELRFGKYVGLRVTDNKEDIGLAGGYEAKEGRRYAEVVIEVTQGESAKNVTEWAVKLQDSAGNSYEVLAHGWGVPLGSANNAEWTFNVPENETHLTLIFPGGASIDLAPLASK